MTSARAAFAAVLALPALATADPTRNIDLTVFDPTPATVGSSIQVQNADVGDNGDIAASAFASYASNPLVLGTDTATMPIVRHRTMLSVGLAYAFADQFEAGVRMPLYMQSGEPIASGTTTVDAASGTATGDLTLHGKVRLVTNGPIHAGVGLALTLPTATKDEFTGNNSPTGRLLGLLTYAPIAPLTLNVNAGAVIRQKAEFANIQQGSGITAGLGLSFRAFERVFLDVEAFGDAIPGGTLSRPTTSNPMGTPTMLKTFEALAGARVQLTRQMSLGVAAGRGLTSDVGSPDLRGVLTFSFAPSARPLPPLHSSTALAYDASAEDTDGDRLNDAADKCPKEPEDRDGFEDDDGCPDPDNDKDGILDKADKCPDKAETINGNDDDDGCPDKGDALVISNPDRLELLEPVLFTGTAIAKDSANVMNQLATTLRARADVRRLRITVHVNPSKSAAKDQSLTDKRAESVKEYLIRHGVASDRVEVKGFGSTKPLVPATQKGAAMINDRVELIILERN